MADKKPDTKYYRCFNHAGLGIFDGDKMVARFQPFAERYQGETVKVGYLETDDAKVQARLDADSNVEVIEKKDYEAVVKKQLKLSSLPLE